MQQASKVKAPSGIVFYNGASQIDGSPIVGIALLGKSSNAKTGAMIQTYIIRADQSPIDAVNTGADYAICGGCGHRKDAEGKRTCYVTLMHGPLMVWKSFQRGNYMPIDAWEDLIKAPSRADARARIATGRNVRLGTYGDPAAIPAHVWRELLAESTGHTGYTHQWRMPIADALRDIVMASVDTPDERAQAVREGWRTFRVKTADAPMLPREVTCPASDEAGKKTDCNTCQACKGNDGRKGTIVINAHGTAKRYFALKLQVGQ